MPDLISTVYYRFFPGLGCSPKRFVFPIISGFTSPLILFLLLGNLAWANVPGGGTNGANVTLTDNGATVTLDNGIISIVVTKADASIHTINYTFNNTGSTQTINVLGNGYSGGKLYWENSSDLGPSYTYAVAADPATNGGNYAEVVLTASGANNVSNIEMEVHFSLLRGNSGFYVTPIWIHSGTDDGFSIGECRDNIYSGSIFNWMSVDATRNKLMPVTAGTAIAVNSGPKEVSLWISGIYAGQYEDKYKYTADYSTLRAWGWSSVGAGGKNVGLWDVAGSAEYMASGPMRRELICHMGTTILNTPHGTHYGFCTDSTWAAGEVWAKVCGPHFIYCNNLTNTITVTNTAAQTLYADALTQADAEKGAWPYAWFNSSYYTPASGRGTVTGKIVIADSYNPNASASNLWVGVELQPNVSSTITYDFQNWYKTYQFWVKTDANGNFTIPNVIATNGYTLYAFGPGAAGTFQSQAQVGGSAPIELDIPSSPFSVTVAAGATNNLGAVTWTPARVGPTVFEIGYPDRTGAKFRHGEDWWVGDIGPGANVPSPVWSKFLEYPFDFPAGPNYVVGQSRWTTDWNFIQPVVINSTGPYDPWGNNSGTTSTINFNLPAAPAGNGSFYVGLSSDYMAAIIITVNGNLITSSTGYYSAYGNSQSDASIREGIHGLFSDNRLSISTNYLHAGQNTIAISIRQVGGNYLANHAMYDYLRLEVPGYLPPAPVSVRAFAGNSCNLVTWPVQPGATSYNILRSTTNGSGYVSVTNGVTGPVCGCGAVNALWLDTSALNGTNYYYVVRSVNPLGSSTNSPPSSGAMPSAAIAATAPAAPAGLIIGSTAHQSVTLNWSAASGANFYTVYRSTLFNNGGGASNVLGTIVLNNAVTNTTYTDASPTDGSIYRYVVTATGAGGTSTNSAPAAAVPLPTTPNSAPPSVTAHFVSTTNITLTWTAVPGAVGYVSSRATSSGGPYTYLQTITQTIYTDYGLNPATIYYYRVAAMNAAGISANNTDSVNSQQAYPPSLTATATNAQVALIWVAATGATSYTVKRGTSVGGENVTVVTGYPGTTYTNTGLANGTTYYYVVTATGAGGASGNSPEVSATPLVTGNGVWISSTGGNWSGASNWLASSIAAGTISSADFSTLSLATNLTVTLDGARTIGSLIFGDATATYNWTLAGTNSLTLGTSPVINVENQSAIISTPLAGSNGLSKIGLGALTLGGATNIFTGGLAVNAGSLMLDYSAANSPVTNLIPAPNSLTLGGGTLAVIGGVTSTQTFAGTVLNAGASVVSGTNLPAVNLAGITANAGGVLEFIGPATVGLGGVTVASSAVITTTAGGNNAFLNSYALIATVGLYDYAAAIGSSSPYLVVGGSQIAGFYTAASGGGAPTGGNLDVTGSAISWSAQPYLTGMRFKTNVGANIAVTAYSVLTLADILVTPGVGAHNVTYSSGVFRPNGNASGPFVVWQNNPAGELILNTGIENAKNGTSAYIQNGAGTVILASAGSSYSDQSYLNGGVTLIAGNGSLGAVVTAATVNLTGGTLAANSTFSLDNGSAASARFVWLNNLGGGLAATTGNSLTVDGVIGSAANAGSLTIGIPASGANNNTAGLLPGTGAGTANAAVYANGTVVLSNANYFTGGTVLQSGTLNINGIYALGGANYGGLIFNGGTLQYAANFPGNNGSADLTSIGTVGILLAAGGGAIDLNGNAVIYAGAIGNNGTGSLLVKSSLPGGVLNLQGANNYSGMTTVTNAVLSVNNPTGSGTGSGMVLVQNAGSLSGNGAVAGSVTVASGGTLAIGNGSDSLTVGNNLTLNLGSATILQVQHSPLTNSSINIANTLAFGGSLVVTNIGAAVLTAGDIFTLFNAPVTTGGFNNISLPALNPGLFWSTARLAVDGTLAVVSTNSPSSSGAGFAGGNLVWQGTGGTPNWYYTVLTATNLAQPLSQWTAVYTNQFDAAGNFNCTNVIGVNVGQQYYLLKGQ